MSEPRFCTATEYPRGDHPSRRGVEIQACLGQHENDARMVARADVSGTASGLRAPCHVRGRRRPSDRGLHPAQRRLSPGRPGRATGEASAPSTAACSAAASPGPRPRSGGVAAQQVRVGRSAPRWPASGTSAPRGSKPDEMSTMCSAARATRPSAEPKGARWRARRGPPRPAPGRAPSRLVSRPAAGPAAPSPRSTPGPGPARRPAPPRAPPARAPGPAPGPGRPAACRPVRSARRTAARRRRASGRRRR